MLSAALLAAAITLQQPIACEVGRTCFIQQGFDHDPGPGAKDYRCGSITYDGHDGTDFRVPTLKDQRQGVEVLAAADGTVKAMRDGMEDISVDKIGKAAVAGRECGNGVVLTHADGWETQYCHMAKGSVRVRAGQAVRTGEVLGKVGESGDAAFPHLHLSVRKGAEKVDPFAYGAAAGDCGTGASLWSPTAAKALAYRSPELINFGFADAAVSLDDIEEGRFEGRSPGADAPAVVAFIRAIGLLKDDVLTLELTAPDGRAARGAPVTLDHDKAQYMLFAGLRRPAAGGWAKGAYQARFRVMRAGKPVLERSFALSL
jgi:hypothetical protein